MVKGANKESNEEIRNLVIRWVSNIAFAISLILEVVMIMLCLIYLNIFCLNTIRNQKFIFVVCWNLGLLNIVFCLMSSNVVISFFIYSVLRLTTVFFMNHSCKLV